MWWRIKFQHNKIKIPKKPPPPRKKIKGTFPHDFKGVWVTFLQEGVTN